MDRRTDKDSARKLVIGDFSQEKTQIGLETVERSGKNMFWSIKDLLKSLVN